MSTYSSVFTDIYNTKCVYQLLNFKRIIICMGMEYLKLYFTNTRILAFARYVDPIGTTPNHAIFNAIGIIWFRWHKFGKCNSVARWPDEVVFCGLIVQPYPDLFRAEGVQEGVCRSIRHLEETSPKWLAISQTICPITGRRDEQVALVCVRSPARLTICWKKDR